MTLPANAIASIKQYLLNLQHDICRTLESIDQNAIFLKDEWTRSGGGGGLTCVMEQGRVFSKAGVNFSHVTGNNLPKAATQQRLNLEGASFEALGVSLVIHPLNPYVPTTHFNVRFFVATGADKKPIWWFGGGFDLTPYYGFEEDCIHWHKTAFDACQPFGEDLYARLKDWCDNYFYLTHRQEARGIGGLFFDDFQEGGFDHAFNFMQSIGNHFLKAYVPIVLKRQDTPYGDREIQFQRYRRGRYVEFNLIYDRGTLFGLQSGGRTESILMSLPDVVHWHYDWHPAPGSEEEKLYTDFLPKKDWYCIQHQT